MKAQGSPLIRDGFSRCPRTISDGEEDPRHVHGAEIGLQRARKLNTEERLVKPNKRIFDNKKISTTSDHPDDADPASLRGGGSFYDLVVKRFLAVFFRRPSISSRRESPASKASFQDRGPMMTQAGWLGVYGKEAETGESSSLVAIKNGEKVRAREWSSRQPDEAAGAFTRSDASLCDEAPENWSRRDLREAMSEKGLGTPATRAQIIEGLIYEDYVHLSSRASADTQGRRSFRAAPFRRQRVVLARAPATGNSS